MLGVNKKIMGVPWDMPSCRNAACGLRALGSQAFRSSKLGSVKELKLSYYIGETLLFTVYTHYGNLI